MRHKIVRNTIPSQCSGSDLLSCILLALSGLTASLLLISPDRTYVLYVTILLLLVAVHNWSSNRITVALTLLVVVLMYSWLVYTGYLYLAIMLIITYIILLSIPNRERALLLSPLVLLSAKHINQVFSLIMVPSIIFFIGLATYISTRRIHVFLVYVLGSVVVGVIAFLHGTGYIWLDNLWEIYLLSTIYALIVAVISTTSTIAPYCPFHKDQYIFSLGTLLGLAGLILSLFSQTSLVGYSLWLSGFILVIASSLVPRTTDKSIE